MRKVLGKDHLGREVSTLDVDVKQRLELLEQVIAIRRSCSVIRNPRERAQAEEEGFQRLRASVSEVEKAYLDKLKSPDGGGGLLPLESERHPSFFPDRQKGDHPTTLLGMKAGYEAAIAQEKGAKGANA